MTLWSRWAERGKIKGSNFYIGIGKKIHKNHYTKKVNFMWRPWGRFENIFIEQVWIESFLFHNTQQSILGSHAQFIYTLYFQIVNIKKTNTVKKWYKVPVKFFFVLNFVDRVHNWHILMRGRSHFQTLITIQGQSSLYKYIGNHQSLSLSIFFI